MKSTFLPLALLICAISFSAHATPNDICFSKIMVIREDTSQLAGSFERDGRILNNFIAATDEALKFSLTLASGNTPPNDYLMTMVNDANDIFTKSLTRSLDTTTMMINFINFAKFKKEFNDCLTEELKLKCPAVISKFNSKITSIISNHQEMILQHEALSIAKTHVFSVLKSDYENQIVMTSAKFQELYKTIAPSQFNYKSAIRSAQADTIAASSLIHNELAECLLR